MLTRAINSPAIAGPTNRAALKTIELIANAEGSASRSTRVGINARRAGWAIPQSTLTPAVLSERLAELLRDSARLGQAAAQARRFGRDDAAERLAALAYSLAPELNGVKKRRAA